MQSYKISEDSIYLVVCILARDVNIDEFTICRLAPLGRPSLLGLVFLGEKIMIQSFLLIWYVFTADSLVGPYECFLICNKCCQLKLCITDSSFSLKSE